MEERQLFLIDAWELVEDLPTGAFPNKSQASLKSALPGVLAVGQEMGSLDLVKFLQPTPYKATLSGISPLPCSKVRLRQMVLRQHHRTDPDLQAPALSYPKPSNFAEMDKQTGP